MNKAKESDIWVRTVTQSRTLIQFFRASSGKPEYVERDGKMVHEIQPSESHIDTLEQFRRLTPMEQAILESKIPDLWEDNED